MSNNTPTTIKQTLAGDYFRKQVALCLPKHLTPERFCRVALSALNRVPKLQQCTQQSILECMLTCSELGIEPDGRRAHLIPYENKKSGVTTCTLIIDYKGLVELAMRSGMIARIHADLICENDQFDYDLGEILHHKINWREDRGEPYAAYAMAETKDGAKFIQVMTRVEIEKVRDGSQGWIAVQRGWAKQSPWKDNPGEMWKKTVFRRLAKWLPLSPEVQDNIDRDSEPTPDRVTVNEFSSVAQLPESTAAAEPATQPEAIDVETGGETGAEPEGQPATPKRGRDATPQSELERIVTDAGHSMSEWQQWAEGTGFAPDAGSYGSFDDVPDDICKRAIRAKTGMLKGLSDGAEKEAA